MSHYIDAYCRAESYMLTYIITKSLPVFCALPDIKQNDQLQTLRLHLILCSGHIHGLHPGFPVTDKHNVHCRRSFKVFTMAPTGVPGAP